MENAIIKKYSMGLSSYFRTVITKPMHPDVPLENYALLENYYHFKLRELENNTAINTVLELKLVHDTIYELIKEVVRFFIAIQEFNANQCERLELIGIHKVNIEDLFYKLSDFELLIRNYLLLKDWNTATIIQQFCILNLKSANSFLYNKVFLDLDSTPFKSDFEKLINGLSAAIESPFTIKKHLQQNEMQLCRIAPKQKRLADKWYALQYWIELKATGAFAPTSPDGEFVKSKLILIGAEKTGKSGQSFYKWVGKIASDNFKNIKQIFGKNWKQTVIELSQNNPDIVNYLAINFP